MTQKKRITRLARQLRKGWGIDFILAQKCAKDIVNNYGLNVINMLGDVNVISDSWSDDIYQDHETVININGRIVVLQKWGL